MSDGLKPWDGDGNPPAGYRRRTAWDDCIAGAAQALQAARARREALTPRDAAREAYLPGGPSVAELETQIRRHREEARERAAQDRSGPTDASPPTGPAAS